MFRARELILSVLGGGTGRNNLTPHGVLLGNASQGITATSAGSAGQLLLATSGVPVFRGANYSQTTVASPTGTTSTTGVMMGLNAAITPLSDAASIMVIVCGDVTNNTKADGAKIVLRFGSGTAPTNGAAPTGTIIASTATQLINAGVTGGSARVPFSLIGLAGGTINTAAWFDVSLAAVTGGTATIANVMIQLYEVK